MASSEIKNARAISSVVSPPERPQRERNLRLERQRGMTAGEDQLEPLVLDHRLVKSVHRHFGHLQLTGLFG
jgi:hypothetical protein